RSGRGTPPRCSWRCRWIRKTPRRARRPAARSGRRSPPVPDCRARRRRYTRRSAPIPGRRIARRGRAARSAAEWSLSGLGHGVSRRLSGRADEVQNPVAVIALDDLFVLADRVEDLRPQPNVADRADAVARFGNGHAVALLRDLFEDPERVRIERSHDFRPFGAQLFERGVKLAVLRSHRLAIRVDRLLL